jgi:hypothetical protein
MRFMASFLVLPPGCSEHATPAGLAIHHRSSDIPKKPGALRHYALVAPRGPGNDARPSGKLPLAGGTRVEVALGNG